MTRAIGYCIVISLATIVIVLTAAHPEIMSDRNKFLEGFVPHEFLPTVGIMLTITLASSAQIHLTLNTIEERHNRVVFTKTRANVKSSAYWLISLFLISILLVIIKSSFLGNIWIESLLNGAALLLLVWTTLIMTSIMQLVFTIKPDLKD